MWPKALSNLGFIATFIPAERQELCPDIFLLMESCQCVLIYGNCHRQNWRCSFSSVAKVMKSFRFAAMPLIQIPEMGYGAVLLWSWSRGALVLQGALTAGNQYLVPLL
jgi:hypothetical protein